MYLLYYYVLSTFYNGSPLSQNNNNHNAYAYDALGFVKRRHITMMMMMIAYIAAPAPHAIYII